MFAGPVFAKGFRPFFVLASAYGLLVMPWWLHIFLGPGEAPGAVQGIHWHAHAMLHGFTVAVVAGFLLTAVSNWTRQPTATGPRLAGLAALWTLGRVGPSAFTPDVAAAIDLAFIPALLAAIVPPLWRAGSRRNAGIPVVLTALWVTNLLVHLDATQRWPGVAVQANQAAVSLIGVLMLVIGGRIIPLFTRGRTRAEGIRSLPAFDVLAIGATATFALLQLLGIGGAPAAAVAGLGAVGVLARSVHWGLGSALRVPMLWILHAGHAFIALGLLLHAVGPHLGVPPSAATHAITAGAIGALTLGMMARVSLGHTGRIIEAGPATIIAFVAMLTAGLTRSLGPALAPAHYVSWLWISGLAWTLAWLIFLPVYLPVLTRPRPDGSPG